MLENWGQRSSTPFDLLDTSLYQYLHRVAAIGVCDFVREPNTPPGVAIYRLSQEELGELGTIKLLRLTDHSTDIDYHRCIGKAGEHYMKLLEGWQQELLEMGRAARLETVKDIKASMIKPIEVPQSDVARWHIGKTLSDTPTSGSIIQLPDGELIRAEKIPLPLPDGREAEMRLKPSPFEVKERNKPKRHQTEWRRIEIGKQMANKSDWKMVKQWIEKNHPEWPRSRTTIYRAYQFYCEYQNKLRQPQENLGLRGTG